MRRRQTIECLQCDEPIQAERGSLVTCHDCGFCDSHVNHQEYELEERQVKEGRTLDLVETFNFLNNGGIVNE